MKIDDKYKWLARDKDGRLFSFSEKPFKNEEYKEWYNTGFHSLIEEKDERFSFIRWLDNDPIKISNIGNILALDSKEVYTSVNGVEPLGVSTLDSTVFFKEIGLHLEPDTNDIISKPSHYIGINGLEVEQILAEFLPKIEDSYVAHRVGSAIEYLLRSSAKNGDEDIKKAGQNIEQIIKYKQGKKA